MNVESSKEIQAQKAVDDPLARKIMTDTDQGFTVNKTLISIQRELGHEFRMLPRNL